MVGHDCTSVTYVSGHGWFLFFSFLLEENFDILEPSLVFGHYPPILNIYQIHAIEVLSLVESCMQFFFFFFKKISRNRRPTSQHQELNQEKKCAHFKGRRDPSDTKHCHVKDRACSLCSMNTIEATIGMSSFNFPFPPFRVVSCEIDTTDMYIWKWSWMLYPPECKAHI